MKLQLFQRIKINESVIFYKAIIYFASGIFDLLKLKLNLLKVYSLCMCIPNWNYFSNQLEWTKIDYICVWVRDKEEREKDKNKFFRK